MENFSHFAFMASIGMIFILLWRLNVSARMQAEMASSMTSQSEVVEQSQKAAEIERAELSDANAQLSQTNFDLTTELTQQRQALNQLQAAHEALQLKYGELETDLLGQMGERQNLLEQYQTEQIEKARLQRRLETLQERQMTQQKGMESLQTEFDGLKEKSKLYQQAVEAAKGRISSLEHDKKQLERDLQQALYQVVELEQQPQVVQKPSASAVSSGSLEPSLPT